MPKMRDRDINGLEILSCEAVNTVYSFGSAKRALCMVVLVVERAAFLLIQGARDAHLLAAAMLMHLVSLCMIALSLAGAAARRTSALGQKRSSAPGRLNVRFAPKADVAGWQTINRRANRTSLRRRANPRCG